MSELAAFVSEVARKTRANKKSAFLSSFAQAVEIADLPATCQPTSVLFDWTELLDDGDLELYRTPSRGQAATQPVPKELIGRLLGEALLVYPDGAGWAFGPQTQPRGAISATKTRFSIPSLLRNQLVVYNTTTTETMPLTRWVRENEIYKITFSDPSFSFLNGALCRKADFQQEVDMVRRTLREEPSLSAAKSEKGDPARIATSFPSDSIFHSVEMSIYPNHRWLCCLDLGDEWADYLCIENDDIIFVHCKHGKPTTSAAAFHEVIGQALKNLSRAQSTPAEFIAKFSATHNTKYWAGRRIRRLRGARAQWPAFEQGVTTLIGTPTAGREVHVVQTMLSKRAFDQAAVSRRPHFIQLVGLLATFIGSCLEKAAKPVIICPP